MIITLWLSVVPPGGGMLGANSGGEIWRREVTTGCVPVPALDRVYLWGDEGDSDGPGLQVYSRYMGASGQWHVELAKVIYDPDGTDLSFLQAEALRGFGHHRDIWWSSQDPWDEMKVQLLAHGWVP